MIRGAGVPPLQTQAERLEEKKALGRPYSGLPVFECCLQEKWRGTV